MQVCDRDWSGWLIIILYYYIILSHTYCFTRILWQNKIRSLVRMNEDIVLPIGFFDIRNPAVLDDLFEKTHVPLHEKVEQSP